MMSSNRKTERDLLMRLVYQMTVTGDWSDEEKESFLLEQLPACADGAETPCSGYFDELLTAVRDNLSHIDSVVEAASYNWKTGRIAKVDLAIIRLATAEILYAPDIPPAVSVNEAVDLARKYGGEKSYGFINGVLAGIVRSQSESQSWSRS
jgi:N utilization substance protein B